MKTIILLLLLLLAIVTTAHSGIYYMADDDGSITRHCGDTPYPRGAIYGVAIRSDIPVERLIYDNGIIRQRSAQEVEAARQAAKPDKLKAAENKFFDLCFAVFGDRTKRGFDELNATIKALSASDPASASALALQLLAVDAECKREIGNKWWDTAAYHEDVGE